VGVSAQGKHISHVQFTKVPKIGEYNWDRDKYIKGYIKGRRRVK